MSCCEVELHVAQIDGVSLSVGKSDVTALTVGSEIYNIDTPPYEGKCTGRTGKSTAHGPR